MKTQHSLTLALAIAGASLVGLTPNAAQAEDIGKAVPKGIAAMKEKNWAEAQKIFTGIVTEHGAKAKEIGDRFGNIYYWKGGAEMQLAAEANAQGQKDKAAEWYGLAQESFAACYATGNKNGQNGNHVKSLLFQGRAMQQLGDYQGALDSFLKFLKERQERDRFEPGTFNINLAICCFKLRPAKFDEGEKYFEAALQNKVRWKVSDAAVVSAFQAFTEAVIDADKESELVDFMNQNRSVLTLKPYQMVQFTPFYQKLATDTLKADMPNAAYNLFALVPGTQVALNDLQVLNEKIEPYPGQGFRDGTSVVEKAKVKRDLDNLSKKNRDGDAPEVVALSALAYTHEAAGNLRGALAAYEQLEMYYNGSKRREDNLYNLSRVAFSLGDSERTLKYGELFKKEFPESEKSDVAFTLMLTSLFQNGKYAECEKLADETLAAYAEKSEINDLALHMAGASRFYQGKYREAQPLLEEHVEKYPGSKSKLAASYFAAANLGKLQEWARSESSLDAFIKKYPNADQNPYLAYALLDSADAAYNQQEDEKALKSVTSLIKDFPNASVMDSALILKGKIEQQVDEIESAIASYKQALDYAKKKGSSFTESEALYRLVVLLGKDKIGNKPNPNMKEALPYYEEFFSAHSNSPFATQVAVAGMPAMIEAGRTEQGLENLRKAIVKVASQKNPAGLDRAINSYTTSYLAAKKAAGVDPAKAADDLKQHYYSLKGIDTRDVRSRALLMFAVLGVYQEGYNEAIKTKNQELAKKNQAEINALFSLMKADFPLDQLSDQILMSIADYLRKRTASPRQAIPYYEERLKRSSKKDYLAARFGIADVKGAVGSKQEMNEAIKDLQQIYAETKDGKSKDERAAASGAQNRIVSIYAKQENYDKAIEEGLAYLNSKDNTYRADVQKVLAESYDAKKDFTNAIKYYVIVSNRKDAAMAIPAKDRATALMWEHGLDVGGKSRKQAAYEVAAGYINSSKAWFEKNKSEIPGEARDAWLNIDKRVKQWEKSGQIKTLEQLAAEKG